MILLYLLFKTHDNVEIMLCTVFVDCVSGFSLNYGEELYELYNSLSRREIVLRVSEVMVMYGFVHIFDATSVSLLMFFKQSLYA